MRNAVYQHAGADHQKNDYPAIGSFLFKSSLIPLVFDAFLLPFDLRFLTLNHSYAVARIAHHRKRKEYQQYQYTPLHP